MSALGQKRTCAPQEVMSALPPIATAKADIRNRSCPLYTRKRTCAAHKVMSALGQKRTFTVSFDYLVGAGEQRWWDSEPKRLRRLDVGDECELRRVLHRQVGGVGAI